MRLFESKKVTKLTEAELKNKIGLTEEDFKLLAQWQENGIGYVPKDKFYAILAKISKKLGANPNRSMLLGLGEDYANAVKAKNISLRRIGAENQVLDEKWNLRMGISLFRTADIQRVIAYAGMKTYPKFYYVKEKMAVQKMNQLNGGNPSFGVVDISTLAHTPEGATMFWVVPMDTIPRFEQLGLRTTNSIHNPIK